VNNSICNHSFPWRKIPPSPLWEYRMRHIEGRPKYKSQRRYDHHKWLMLLLGAAVINQVDFSLLCPGWDTRGISSWLFMSVPWVLQSKAAKEYHIGSSSVVTAVQYCRNWHWVFLLSVSWSDLRNTKLVIFRRYWSRKTGGNRMVFLGCYTNLKVFHVQHQRHAIITSIKVPRDILISPISAEWSLTALNAIQGPQL